VKIIGGYKKTKDALEFTSYKHFSLQSDHTSPKKEEVLPQALLVEEPKDVYMQTTDSL
jgi:hypothetical protein